MNLKNKDNLPSWYFNFLRWFCNPLLIEDIEGDLTELYSLRSKSSVRTARFRLLLDIAFLFRPGIIKDLSLSTIQFQQNMFKNHIITAIRNAKRYKGYTLINLFGLVIGLSASILILLWVQDEVEKDKFHAKSERIYKIWRNMHQGDGTINTTPGIPQPLAEVLKVDYPEIEDVTLLSWPMDFLLSRDKNSSYEIGRYVSKDFFKMFSYPFLVGNSTTALNEIHSIVISRNIAKKYFGENWQVENSLIGESFQVENGEEFIITGVFENTGDNSSLEFDWVIPAKEHIQRNNWVESWYNGGYRILISLKEGADLIEVEQRLSQEINTHINNEANEPLFLQKFNETYLYSNFSNGAIDGGRINYVKMLLVMAIFILIIASINYMNLFTAQASKRAKEIGIRKVIGAPKSSLSLQLFIESFLLSVTSIIIAIGLVFLLLPYFNALTDKLLIIDLYDPKLWLGIIAVTMVTGLLSGSYPAFSLPSNKIVTALKGGIIKSSGSVFRNGLVVFQLALSVLLIAGTIVVSQQMDYIMNKDLGLDKESMVFISMEGDLAKNPQAYKTALLEIPEIKAVSFSSGNPINHGSSTSGASWDGKNPDDVVEINVLSVDVEFIETMGMKMISGRGFSNNFGGDSAKFIINEVLADIIGQEKILELNLSVWGQKGNIIGIVKNFHMDSMYEPIQPLIIRYDPEDPGLAFIRTQANVVSAIESIEEVTANLNPEYPFQYEFLEDDFKDSYRSESTLSSLANIFAIVSIFISSLGLLGISSFSASQRSKEIGVRKVHGASILKVVLLLSKDYAKFMVMAIIIATPLAYYYMSLWLSKFTYKIDLSVGVFLLASSLAFLIGALTVGYKSYHAAVINPIKTLKDE